MKKYIFVIALILVLLTTACGNKGIVGKWKADGYSVDYYYIFNSDKTCAYEMNGAQMECTYEDDGTKVTILYKGNTNSNTYEYRIEGNTLIIKDSFGNDVKYTRK
jgi:uncharacterized lipoprotein YehR (DUF1307 family)